MSHSAALATCPTWRALHRIWYTPTLFCQQDVFACLEGQFIAVLMFSPTQPSFSMTGVLSVCAQGELYADLVILVTFNQQQEQVNNLSATARWQPKGHSIVGGIPCNTTSTSRSLSPAAGALPNTYMHQQHCCSMSVCTLLTRGLSPGACLPWETYQPLIHISQPVLLLCLHAVVAHT